MGATRLVSPRWRAPTRLAAAGEVLRVPGAPGRWKTSRICVRASPCRHGGDCGARACRPSSRGGRCCCCAGPPEGGSPPASVAQVRASRAAVPPPRFLEGDPGVDQWEAPSRSRRDGSPVDRRAGPAPPGTSTRRLWGIGLPDRRSGPLLDAVGTLVGGRRPRGTLPGDTLAAVDALVAGPLPGAAGGARRLPVLPATLVHGDLHPGTGWATVSAYFALVRLLGRRCHRAPDGRRPGLPRPGAAGSDTRAAAGADRSRSGRTGGPGATRRAR